MQNQEDAFIKVLMGEDELGVVVRAHIHIEARINELLEKMAAHPEYIRKMNLDYEQLVNLAVALGLKSESARPLKALGTLRNIFAHRLDTSLTKDRVDSLYKTLSTEDKQIAQWVYERTNVQLSMKDAPTSLRGLRPKDKFVLIAVAMRAMLLAAIAQLNSSSEAAQQHAPSRD